MIIKIRVPNTATKIQYFSTDEKGREVLKTVGFGSILGIEYEEEPTLAEILWGVDQKGKKEETEDETERSEEKIKEDAKKVFKMQYAVSDAHVFHNTTHAAQQGGNEMIQEWVEAALRDTVNNIMGGAKMDGDRND